jgi:AcrR family transcriptional regulator
MSSNSPPGLQKHAAQKKKAARRKPDERTLRTRDRLGSALIELILEKPINDLTVQEVLDRASVGRSTFYLHFRDKNDLLLSQLETFLATMSTMLIVRGEQSHRVVPVTEMFEHIGPDNKIYRALADADRLNDFFDLAQTYFARGIERRLRDSGRVAKARQRELGAHASALAGSLLSLLRWWIDRGGKEAPRAMDELFHRMVWSGLQ